MFLLLKIQGNKLGCFSSQKQLHLKKMFWTFWNNNIELSPKEFLNNLETRLHNRQIELEERLQKSQKEMKSELEARLNTRQIELEERLQKSQKEMKSDFKSNLAEMKSDFKSNSAEMKSDFKSNLSDNNRKLIFMLVPILIGSIVIFETFGFSIDHPWKYLIFRKDKLAEETKFSK